MDFFFNFLSNLAAQSARRPIHTIVFISVLASTAYFSILDLSIPADVNSLAKTFYHPGSQSQSWQNISDWIPLKEPDSFPDADRLLVAKVIFNSDSSTNLPHLPNTIQGDSLFERYVILDSSSGQDLQTWVDNLSTSTADDSSSGSFGPWRVHKSSSWVLWVRWKFARLLDLIYQAEPFDLAVVGSAYLAMHYTFISLFLSMRQLGSNFWLATCVLLSSTFAFMFAIVTASYLGVPISVVSLSEGLPFLVATIGFESKISLSKLVLNASRDPATKSIEDAIKNIIFLEARSIFRDYLIEIIALIGGAYSGVNGLWQFCLLSALILLYDSILLITFYSAVLSIKIEIGKIKRNEVIREALEEDGVSYEIAEQVADSSEGKRSSTPGPSTALIDRKSSHGVVNFKLLMIVGFALLNAVQFTKFPFGVSSSLTEYSPSLTETLTKLIPVNSGSGVVLTIYPTIVFEHSQFFVRFEDGIVSFFQFWTEVIGDPLISKCIVIAFAMSVVLNGYLFNVAREPVIKVVEKIVEIEREVPVIVEKASTSDTDSSEEADTDYGIELKSSIKKVSETKQITIQRTVEELIKLMKSGETRHLQDEEVINLALSGNLPLYALEKQLADNTRAVFIRRAVVSRMSDTKKLEDSGLPYDGYNYDRVLGACCENVIGYLPLPVGIAGPLNIDGASYFIPMATTEGCLVASTMRGCKAINAGGGVTTVLTADGMTRGPCVSFRSLIRAGAAKLWLDSEEGQRSMKKAFNSTSRFARLQSIKTAMAGTLLFMRFKTTTGDAMGMNMISKGVEFSLEHMVENCGFEDMEVISVSGNYCTDKKPAAINWIEGRGKSVVAEAIVPGDVVRSVLKSDVNALVELNVNKNLIGSAMAGSVGGFNAHAANLVTAIFLATGQDPAQNVESSNCITLMKNVDGNLHISVSMPSIEVGTIGGGTVLEPQGAMLDLLGVRGPHATNPGDNARLLARIVASGVLAAELSLCSALAAGHLVQSHMTHNRSKVPTPSAGPSAADMTRLTQGSQICIKS